MRIGRRWTGKEGVTLTELLVTVVVIALLVSLLGPTLSQSRQRARLAACLNNLRQLQIAWLNYVDDYSGMLPPNTSEFSNGVWRSDVDTWAGPSSALFDQNSRMIMRGLFFRLGYFQSVAGFVCPSDEGSVLDERRQAMELSRTRSYSMNGSLGGRESEVQPVVNHDRTISAPARLFVFIDEHQESIDDGHFLVWPLPDSRWVNLPADRHDGKGVLSFADGHVESWKWKARKSFSGRESYWKRAKSEAELRDLRRLQTADFGFRDIRNYQPQN